MIFVLPKTFCHPHLNKKHLYRMMLFASVLVLLCAFPLYSRGEETTTEKISAEEMTARLEALCEENGWRSGATWQPAIEGTEETLSQAFASWIGMLLFGEEYWECLDTPPLVKARGLRVGDILRTPGHAAVILSLTEDGKIRTVECRDEDGVITAGEAYLGDEECCFFDGLVEKCGFECVLKASGNPGPVVWSAWLAALPEEPAITGETYPTVLSNGQFFGLRGTVACRYPLTRIQAVVSNRVSGEVIFDISVYPNTNTYAIGNPVDETINDSLVFNSPECANSYLNYSVTACYEKDGETLEKTVLNKDFKVGRPVGEPPEGFPSDSGAVFP